MSYLKLTNNPYYYPKTIIDELKVRGKFFRDDNIQRVLQELKSYQLSWKNSKNQVFQKDIWNWMVFIQGYDRAN